MFAGAILCTGRVLLALDDRKGRGMAKVCACCTEAAGSEAMGWSCEGGGGGCADMEPYSERWVKVVAASLGVTVEEAVCVITDGATVSSRAEVLSRGEGTMRAAEPMS